MIAFSEFLQLCFHHIWISGFWFYPGLKPAPDPGKFSPDSCQYVNEIFLSGEPDAGGAGQLPVCWRDFFVMSQKNNFAAGQTPVGIFFFRRRTDRRRRRTTNRRYWTIDSVLTLLFIRRRTVTSIFLIGRQTPAPDKCQCVSEKIIFMKKVDASRRRRWCRTFASMLPTDFSPARQTPVVCVRGRKD